MDSREKETLEKLAKDGMHLARLRNMTWERCMTAVKSTGMALRHVPEESMTADICEAAVKRSPLALAFVPARFQSSAMCEKAVEADGMALEFVSPDLVNRRICALAVESDPFALRHVPGALMSDELRNAAISANPDVVSMLSEDGDIPDAWKEALAEPEPEPEPELRFVCNVRVNEIVSWNPETGEAIISGNPEKYPQATVEVRGKCAARPDEGHDVKVSSPQRAMKVRAVDAKGRQMSDERKRPVYIFRITDAMIGEAPATGAKVVEKTAINMAPGR